MIDKISKQIKKTWLHEGFHKYLNNFSWMFWGRVITMIISFISTLYIARNLGPTNFGELSYALSLVGLFGFIAPLGLDGILYRELVRHPDKRHILLGTTFWLRLTAGTLVSIITIIVALHLSSDDVSRILILILAITFIFNSFQIANFQFLARTQSQYQAIITIIVTIILNALKILIIAYGEGVIYLSLILLLESILYAFLYIFVYQWKSGDHVSNWKFDKQIAKSLISDSLPIMLVSGFIAIYARIDQVFIKHILGAEYVGIYDAAVRLVDVWNFIPGVLGAALFPAIVNAEKVSERLLDNRMKKLTLVFLIIPTIIATLIYYFAVPIIDITYGEDFAKSSSVLKIYVWILIGSSMAIHVQAYLTLKNEKVLLILSALIPMIVNITLNILWIPTYGIIGAAYSSLISYSMIPFFIFFSKKKKILRP